MTSVANDTGYVEVKLSGGRVYRGRPVGPEAWVMIFEQSPMPEEPKETITNDAGMDNEITLAEDDPRYVAYLEELIAYNRKLKEAGWLNFFEDTLEVPDGWDIPQGHKRFGVTLADDPLDRLLQYIRLEVVLSMPDNIALDSAIRGEVDGAEIDAASRLFQGDQEQETASGDTE